MPKWMTFCFALFLSMQVFSTEGKEVDHAINSYIKAMGGMERLHALRSVCMEGIITATDESRAHLTISAISSSLLTGHMVRHSTSFPSGINELKLERLTATSFKFSVNLRDCSFPLADYAGKGWEARLEGREIINGRQTVKVKLSMDSNNYINYYLDADTWLIAREVHFSGTAKQKPSRCVERIDYLNHIKYKQGLVFPSTIVLHHADTTSMISIIHLNK